MVTHLSMRVPWRDQPWDDRLCAHPLDNSSCLLLKNIGAKRDDDYEVAHALQDIGTLNAIPCLSERGTFMSPNGYQVTKVHPYGTYPALKGHLEPTVLSMPPYSFEAVPFRWMARESFEKICGRTGAVITTRTLRRAWVRCSGSRSQRGSWMAAINNQ